jgi:hypothetical protein
MSSLTVRQVADRYAASERVVLSWIAAGELRAINVARHAGAKRPSWRITAEALQAFELSRTPAAAPSRAPRRKRPAEVIEFYK